MRITAAAIAAAIAAAGTTAAGTASGLTARAPVTQARAVSSPPAPARPRRVQAMTLTGPWPDGGVVPVTHTQAGDERSPALSWSGVPEATASFVLIVHDLDAAIGGGIEDVLHWMVWNIPGDVTGLPGGVPQGPSRPDGSRQISVSGPYYRGPGAPAAGPVHHYVFELYALDAPVAVPATGLPPADTRAAVLAAMAGHVLGKGVYTGRFRRGL